MADMAERLRGVMRRAGIDDDVSDVRRLSGGANMESWFFACGACGFVLRRAPSAAWLAQRALDLAAEASIIRYARDGGVSAPEVICELEPGDDLGIGFIMRALPGTTEPKTVLSTAAPQLIDEIATALARIHALPIEPVAHLPTLDAAEGVAKLTEQFEAFGGDRPVLALGLAWLRAHLPGPTEARLVHGDLRIGNLMTDEGHLSGVLDWELAHLGDPHEDLAFGCMSVWRFGEIDKPAFGLASLETFFAAYESASGGKVDRARFDFWLIYRTVWWALGCLSMGRAWRERQDRSLERVVVARRAAEQELDLLLLLDAGVGQAPQPQQATPPEETGEPSADEILSAVSEWLADKVKPQLSGRDRFDLAVAQNAIGIVRRELSQGNSAHDRALAQDILAGRKDLSTPGLAQHLRAAALAKVRADMPKYPSIPLASARWEQK